MDVISSERCVMKMTENGLKNRLMRVNALRLTDPWGVEGVVCQFDLQARTVWLRYEGLPVPFERSFDELVLAANGTLRDDPAEQFVKRLLADTGLVIEFHYERILGVGVR